MWLGCDVSRDMLNMANERIEQMREGDSEYSEDEDESMHDTSNSGGRKRNA